MYRFAADGWFLDDRTDQFEVERILIAVVGGEADLAGIRPGRIAAHPNGERIGLPPRERCGKALGQREASRKGYAPQGQRPAAIVANDEGPLRAGLALKDAPEINGRRLIVPDLVSVEKDDDLRRKPRHLAGYGEAERILIAVVGNEAYLTGAYAHGIALQAHGERIGLSRREAVRKAFHQGETFGQCYRAQSQQLLAVVPNGEYPRGSGQVVGNTSEIDGRDLAVVDLISICQDSHFRRESSYLAGYSEAERVFVAVVRREADLAGVQPRSIALQADGERDRLPAANAARKAALQGEPPRDDRRPERQGLLTVIADGERPRRSTRIMLDRSEVDRDGPAVFNLVSIEQDDDLGRQRRDRRADGEIERVPHIPGHDEAYRTGPGSHG